MKLIIATKYKWTSSVVQVNYATGQLTSTGDSVILNGTMISASEMWCELPETGVSNGTAVVLGVVLSVSTDGVHFSNELFLTIYDSTCMQCNTSAQCWKKVNHRVGLSCSYNIVCVNECNLLQLISFHCRSTEGKRV